ncbi:MAG: desulfoferrodoxin [Bacillota bacterium]|jgi:superoxide reductase
MIKVRDIYYCSVCGNVVEILQAGAPALVCCKQPMEKLEPKTEDTGNEKHVPVKEVTESGIKVQVGSIEHPMEEKHSIRFVEVLTEKQVWRAELMPGQKPLAEFPATKEEILEVREYCNIHGLWKSK